jgi:hypothetical protein
VERRIIPARPTTYKGIKMRSRLEADYASALDRDGEVWEYEPTCFAGPDGQWLPDFKIGIDGAFVELKPAYLMAWDTQDFFDTYHRVDKILRQMTIAWLSEPDASLQLIFWTYGLDQAQAPLTILGSKRSHAWYTWTPSTADLPLLWPGMGQFLTVAKHGELKAEQS